MFSNIRNTLAALIATKDTGSVTKAASAIKQPDHLKVMQFQPHDRTISRKSVAEKKVSFEGITGKVSLDIIRDLSSNTLRKSLVGKLVYSTLAKGFTEWQKRGTRTENQSALEQALNAAAEAVAASDSLGYTVDLNPDNYSFLLLNGVPGKMSEAHAKMICDITGGDVAALTAKREQQRKDKLLSNQDSLATFLLAVEGWTISPKYDAMGELIEAVEPTVMLSGASAMSGIASCMEFVTSWSNEITMAAEMMLIKADTKMIEAALAKTTEKEQREAPEYVTRLDRLLLDANGLAAGAASGK